MENEFLTDSELLATVADIKAVIKGAKGDKGEPGGNANTANITFASGGITINKADSANISAIDFKNADGSFFRWQHMSGLFSVVRFDANLNGLEVLNISNSGSIAKIGGGSFSAISDKRMKKEIVTFNSGLDKVLAIQPKRFKYNAVAGTPTENYPAIITEKQQYGVIAQDLQTVCPEMVTADENGFLSVDLSNLSLLLINAVKELTTKIGSLEARIVALETPQA
jgi:hypothetical protein